MREILARCESHPAPHESRRIQRLIVRGRDLT
jgi:hypothetical protein